MTPKMCYRKQKFSQLYFIKIKDICSVKDSADRIKRQATDWEKAFANHISGSRLVYQ